ncbi:hypothetical protein [Nocardioides marmoribigeumensis]|uniref:Uncharacterized protein n=1 Tax=Nocardioides marmoribigeumensis TaxID=433649 RepID=A0ABU2C0D0_9ACTN|nr:hypothetical protein [Nocardioides marmoribigeumensis]MDR7364059.1 hypothetical protein [Nocardioides marmoribigeumensis]
MPTVSAACARLAALRRWRCEDDPGVVQAERDLVVAHAAALTAEAARLLRGEARP